MKRTPELKHFIDEPQFSFRELLHLAGISRGTAEGYMKRGIVIPSASKIKGKGHHRAYTARDAMKFAAVLYMSRSGVQPDWVKFFVASEIEVNSKTHEKGRGSLDLVIDDYAANGEQSQYRHRSPYVFNAVIFGSEVQPFRNAMQSNDFIERMATGLREHETVTYVAFDAWIFVRLCFQATQNYLKQRAAE